MLHDHENDAAGKFIRGLGIALLMIAYYGFIGFITYYTIAAPLFGLLVGWGAPAGLAVILLAIPAFVAFWVIYLLVAFIGIIFSPGPVI